MRLRNRSSNSLNVLHISRYPIRASRFFRINVLSSREISKLGEAEDQLLKASGHRTKEDISGKRKRNSERDHLERTWWSFWALSGIPATFIRQRNKLQLSPGTRCLNDSNELQFRHITRYEASDSLAAFPACVDCANGRVSPPLLEMDRTRYLIIGYGAHVSIPWIAQTVLQSRFTLRSTTGSDPVRFNDFAFCQRNLIPWEIRRNVIY